MLPLKNAKICIVGLGYVGLPLAVEFGRKYHTIGFDLKVSRIQELQSGIDTTLEVTKEELSTADKLFFTSKTDDIRDCTIYIVSVPTPIDDSNRPNLSPLENASTLIGRVLTRDDLVIYESTVYPGATEEVCVPILEKESSLVFNEDFFCGYSPERINPGDKEHRLPDIVKVTSGSTPETTDIVDSLYRSIITAGTHCASSIKVAEAAKVIENTQRDVNIALINELSLIFNKLGISTKEVLDAAATKWNFLPFQPGLVGGHCIGVDPYYLTHKAQEVGYHPEMILAGRRLNDQMGQYVASMVIKLMMRKNIDVSQAKILIMGLTFKENCPDLRNTKVINIIHEFVDYGLDVEVYDPWVNQDEASYEYDLNIVQNPHPFSYDGIVLAVAHRQFIEMGGEKIRELCSENGVIYDVKNVLPVDMIDGCL